MCTVKLYFEGHVLRDIQDKPEPQQIPVSYTAMNNLLNRVDESGLNNVLKNVNSKEITCAQHKYMNIHTHQIKVRLASPLPNIVQRHQQYCLALSHLIAG